MFKHHLLSVVNQGLLALDVAQSKGKVPKNNLSESHFFSVWVGQAIKSKQFDISVLAILKAWQQQARTQGAGANLRQIFSHLQSTYSPLADSAALSNEQFEAMLKMLGELGWQLTCDITIKKKLAITSNGNSSLVMAEDDRDNVFLTKNKVSCYVRGQQQQFIDVCYALGILVFKVTDYKSAVKFHGEFILQINNNYNQLAQIPTEHLS